ncbi:MAG TPA: phosphate signaling complex protein PhoU [Armatimonadota bacterium]|jgi:phosphate transport system protein
MLRTRHAFDEELTGLKQELVKMGAFVESMLDRSVRALEQHDVNMAQQVIADDDVVDDLDLAIEQHCMRLLALQQPMSRDLRTVGTVMKVIADVERVGDYCVDIAKVALSMADIPYFKELVDIPRMGVVVGDMLRGALQALVHEDLERVRQVVEQDDEVDRLWYGLLEELITIMEQRPDTVRQAVQLVLVARYLERIADHVVNVVERVAYMATGKLEDLSSHHVITPHPEDAE